MDLGFFFIDVEAGGPDLTVLEGFDEGGFVHYGAAGGVYYYNTGFHHGEFFGGDYVAGVFLGSSLDDVLRIRRGDLHSEVS